MTNFKTVLCPVDFSDYSRHALEHAVRLARWFESSLTVLYVYPLPGALPNVLFGGLPGPLPAEPFPRLTTSPQQTHQEMTAELTTFAGSVDTAGLTVSLHARPGSPVRTILDEAKTLNTDLIVLGTHGHSGFDRWVLGSVTEKVLRKAVCPVLTVPPPVTEAPRDGLELFKRVLCPLDFSDASLRALEHALALARETDAELCLMHVIEGVPDLEHWQQPNSPALVEYLRLSQQDALARLGNVLPQDAHAWCHPETVLATGKPHAEILRIAREREIHLIVMGVHGRNPLDLMFFGSTTHHVIRGATCPVLTLKG